MKAWSWLAFVMGCAGASGCGGAAQRAPAGAPTPAYQQPGYVDEPEAADSEAKEPEAETGGLVPGGAAQQPSRRNRVESRYAQPPPEPTLGLSGADVWSLLEDFDVAEGLALSGQGGCEDACRALRSMIRSAERLCTLAQDEQERRVCQEVRRRVQVARDHVRSSCGRCIHGPDLDRDR